MSSELVATPAAGQAHGARRHYGTHATGASLLELLVVMALIALAGMLAIAAFSGGLDGMRLRSSAKEIASQLRHIRAQAIASGREQRFEIDPAQRLWQTSMSRHGKVPNRVDVSFMGAHEAGLRPEAGAILFFEDGGSTGGHMRLQSGKAVWQIDVAWLTGEVTLSRARLEPSR